jgi:transposase
MFALGPATKIYICLDAVDMRKGFDGLYGLVRDHLGQDPQSGHLFLFTNRSHTRLKALVWDGSGLCNPPQKPHSIVLEPRRP